MRYRPERGRQADAKAGYTVMAVIEIPLMALLRHADGV